MRTGISMTATADDRRFAASALKTQFTRSGAGRARWSRTVVTTPSRRLTPIAIEHQ
jgi:hypothetical protein